MSSGIINLVGTYCHAINRGTSDEVVRLFAEDATFVAVDLATGEVHPGGGPCVGHDEIRAWFDGYFAFCDDVSVWSRHRLSSPSFELLDDNTATCVSYADAMTRWKDGRITNHVVRYEDVVRRTSDRWVFAERKDMVGEMIELATLEPVDD